MATKFWEPRIVRIPKGNGRFREIAIPSGDAIVQEAMRAWRRCLTRRLESLPDVDHIHGFRPLRNAVTNAEAHVGYEYTVSVDLQDFFPSISDVTVARVLLEASAAETAGGGVPPPTPGTLWWKLPSMDVLLTVNGALPQGYPTSPAIANLVGLDMDRPIKAFLRLVDPSAVYTRYADDLTVSTNDRSLSLALPAHLEAMCAAAGFNLATKKTRVQWAGAGRRVVCGVAVGPDTVYATRVSRRKLRAAEHRLTKTGSERARMHAAGLREWTKLRRPVVGRAMRGMVADAVVALSKGDDRAYEQVAFKAECLGTPEQVRAFREMVVKKWEVGCRGEDQKTTTG